MAQGRECLSLPRLPTATIGSRVTCSVCYSSAAFVSACLCPPASADVAVPLTLLATIAQLARGLESLGGEASRWKVLVPACAEKQVAELRPTSWCEIWTLQHLIPVMAVGWRLWLMASPSSGEHSLPWTQRSFLHSTVTGLPHQEQLTPMVQFWPEQGGAKREPAQSWFSRGRGPDWWCWPVKCLDVGQMRHVGSLGCWHVPGPGMKRSSCVGEWSKGGGSGGGRCCPVLQRELSLHPCWA